VISSVKVLSSPSFAAMKVNYCLGGVLVSREILCTRWNDNSAFVLLPLRIVFNDQERWGLFLKQKLLILALCGWYAYRCAQCPGDPGRRIVTESCWTVPAGRYSKKRTVEDMTVAGTVTSRPFDLESWCRCSGGLVMQPCVLWTILLGGCISRAT
jgi:hypothetical protein